MIAQIIDLTNPKIFESYRLKYGYSWDNYYNGLIGLEIREINDSDYNELLKTLTANNHFCFGAELPNNNSRIMFVGNTKYFRELSEQKNKLGEIRSLVERTVNNFDNYNSITYEIKSKEFNFNSSYVMGVLNVTPDSFSENGKYFNIESAAEHGIDMIDQGADIIDIGGESTRPGSDPISTEEEIKRVIPVIQKILLERPSAVISIDTAKKAVALEALQSGAVIVNDISGLKSDPKLIEIVKKFKASLIIMHILGTPKTMQNNPEYDDVVEEIYNFLYAQANLALNYDIKNIFIDPGIGFGKNVEHNLEIIRRLSDFKSLGYPILIGLSRKSFIGKILNLDIDNRDNATAMVQMLAVKNGARVIRTHNVDYGVQVSKLMSSLS